MPKYTRLLSGAADQLYDNLYSRFSLVSIALWNTYNSLYKETNSRTKAASFMSSAVIIGTAAAKTSYNIYAALRAKRLRDKEHEDMGIIISMEDYLAKKKKVSS